MSDTPHRVLLIEDSPSDRRLVAEALAEAADFVFQLDSADRLATGLAHLARSPVDVVLLDLGLPDSEGLDTVSQAAQRAREVPIVVLTDLNDQATALEAVRRGAQDYLFKEHLEPQLLARTIRHSIERCRIQRALRESEERHRNLLAVIPDIVFKLDGDGAFTFVNDAVHTLGYAPDELIGRSFGTIVHPDDSPKVNRTLLMPPSDSRASDVERPEPAGDENASARPLAVDLEIRLVAKRDCELTDAGEETRERIGLVSSCGQVRPSRPIVNEACAPTGSLIGTVGIIRDITARREAEQEKARLSAQLYQADKMTSVGQMAAGIAHEINNPVAFLLANLETLQKQVSALREILSLHEHGASPAQIAAARRSPDYPAHLDEIPSMLVDCLDGAQRIADTTRELRQFSRVDDAAAEQVSLADLVDSSLAIAAHQLRYRATVVKDYAPVPKVLANRGKLSQVILNVLVNAVQAIEEGNVEGNQVKLAIGRREPFVFVEITNTGEPIPPDVMPKIFDPFFTTKAYGEGTGLGLSISYAIVEQHGGHIEVESTAEAGTTFRICLPLQAAEPEPSRPAVVATRKPAQAGRILVVDDEPAACRALRRLLERERSHTVVVAFGGREAVELLERDHHFDAVLCDLNLPHVAGAQIYEQVKATSPELAPKFIFMTGGAFLPQSKRFLDSVNNPTLDKPIDADELLDLLDALMGS